MQDKFSLERRWFPAGESVSGSDANTYLLSMTDGRGTFIEWSEDDARKRKRGRVFSGDLWVLPPSHSWWVRRESGKTCINLSLSAEWLHQIVDAAFTVSPQVKLRDPFLTQTLKTLADASQVFPANATTVLYQESLITTLVLHLVTYYGQAGEKQSGVTPLSSVRLRVLSNYIAEHLSETISLTEMAELAGLSTSQFSLRFRETTGQTPHQFVTAMRVDRARELLVAGKHTPADVALLTGFADQSHLTRHVRRSFGVTPGVLQKQS